MRGVVVAGIGTEVGKSVVSAILCQALGARYWKPVASGIDDGPAESEFVSALIQNGNERVFPETYLFGPSLSPHVAASMEGASIELERFVLPSCEEPLVVELAGGIFVPLNDRETNIDLLKKFSLPVVVVSRHYLGSINHTLLTLDALKSRNILVAGIVFNGEELPDSERVISTMSGARVLGRVPTLRAVTQQTIREVSQSFRGVL